MKRHKHLWDEFISFDNFSRVARCMLKGKRLSRQGARFDAIWEDEVVRLIRDCEAGTINRVLITTLGFMNLKSE